MLTNDYIIYHKFIPSGSIHILEWQKEFKELNPPIKKFKSQKRNIEKWAESILFENTGLVLPTYLESGKPTFKNEFISITHSKKYVAFYHSSKIEVGIDIEEISSKINRIQHKFINENECWNQDIRDLTIIWCCKEVVYKYYDIEGMDFANQITVTPIKDKIYKASVSVNSKIEVIFIHIDKIQNMILAYNIENVNP